MLNPTVNPAGHAATAEDLIGSMVEARALAEGAAGRPGESIAEAVPGSKHGPAGHDSLGDEGVVAFQGLLVVVLGAPAHVDRAYPGGGPFLRQLLKLDQSGGVLAESCVVCGEPADEQALGAQAELGGDRLVTCVQDGEQPADAGAAGRQQGIEEPDEPGLLEAVDVAGLAGLVWLPS